MYLMRVVPLLEETVAVVVAYATNSCGTDTSGLLIGHLIRVHYKS